MRRTRFPLFLANAWYKHEKVKVNNNDKTNIEQATMVSALPVLTALTIKKGPKIRVRTAPKPCVIELDNSWAKVYLGNSVFNVLMY